MFIKFFAILLFMGAASALPVTVPQEGSEMMLDTLAWRRMTAILILIYAKGMSQDDKNALKKILKSMN